DFPSEEEYMQGPMKQGVPVLAGLLLSAVTMLAPLAYATPPDPTWISGFWDDGDHDDVILLITSDISAIESHVATDGGPVRAVITGLAHADEPGVADHALPSVRRSGLLTARTGPPSVPTWDDVAQPVRADVSTPAR